MKTTAVFGIQFAIRAMRPAWWTWRSAMYWRPTTWGWPGGRSASLGPLVVIRKQAR